MKLKIIVYAIVICLLTAIFFSGCSEDNPVSNTAVYPEAAEQNIDVVQLIQAIQNVEQVPGIKSIVLGRNGVIAAQEYYNNAGADIIHDVRSVTKSVMGLLIGIAIEEGYIESVNQTVGEYFIGTVVDSLEPAKAEITIEQLLSMSCGLEWHELDGGNSYSNWYSSSDHVRWVLNRNFIHLPGEGFNYNTGSTHLLSVILTLATGQTALEFAQTYLFEPMGIDQSDWTIIVDRPDEEMNNGGAGLSLSPHAMFDIGNLVLNDGIWNQVQIVPAEWINSCISSQNTTNNAIPYGTQYGYLWWIGQAHGYKHFFAMGWGGQFIVCVPDLNFVVVATCEWQGVSPAQAGQHWYNIFITIMDEILPAVNE